MAVCHFLILADTTVRLILSFVPVRSLFTQITRLSHSFPCLTDTVLQGHHLHLTPALLAALPQSPTAYHLLSKVSSASLVAHERQVIRWRDGDAPLWCVLTLSQLVIHLSTDQGTESDEEDEDEQVQNLLHQWGPRQHQQRVRRTCFNARRRVALQRLFATLSASCALLSSVHLSLTPRPPLATLGEPDDDSQAVAALCQLPSLRLVRLDGLVLNTAAYADLLSVSLTSLDLSRSTLHIGRNGAERDRLGLVSASSLSTLFLPAII